MFFSVSFRQLVIVMVLLLLLFLSLGKVFFFVTWTFLLICCRKTLLLCSKVEEQLANHKITYENEIEGHVLQPLQQLIEV